MDVRVGVWLDRLGAAVSFGYAALLLAAGVGGIVAAVVLAFTTHTWALLAVLVVPLTWVAIWRSP